MHFPSCTPWRYGWIEYVVVSGPRSPAHTFSNIAKLVDPEVCSTIHNYRLFHKTENGAAFCHFPFSGEKDLCIYIGTSFDHELHQLLHRVLVLVEKNRLEGYVVEHIHSC